MLHWLAEKLGIVTWHPPEPIVVPPPMDVSAYLDGRKTMPVEEVDRLYADGKITRNTARQLYQVAGYYEWRSGVSELDHSLEERVAALESMCDADVQRLRLEPGDAVVLKVDYLVSDAERERITAAWKMRLGAQADLFPLFILEQGMDISVLTAGAVH